MSRDNFKKSVKNKLAKEAGYVCSYPLCRLSTNVIVHASGGRIVKKNVGEAAHITAASKHGPRYDKTLTSTQRSSDDNGIWMCRNHAHYIDTMPEIITEEILKEWKRQHLKEVRDGLMKGTNVAYLNQLHSVRSILIDGVLPFTSRVEVEIKRVNFFVGCSNTGKTTLCQAACAFASNGFFNAIRRRFNTACLKDRYEIGIRFGGVGFSSYESYKWQRHKRKLFQLSDANVSQILRVRSILHAIVVGDSELYKNGTARGVAGLMSALSTMLDISVEHLWSAVLATNGKISPLGCEIKRCGEWDMFVKSPYFGETSFGGLSGGERILVSVDLAMRCMYAASPAQHWLFVIENTIVTALDQVNRSRLFSALYATPLNVQVIICANDYEVVKRMIGSHLNEFSESNISGIRILSANADPQHLMSATTEFLG